MKHKLRKALALIWYLVRWRKWDARLHKAMGWGWNEAYRYTVSGFPTVIFNYPVQSYTLPPGSEIIVYVKVKK